MKISTISKTSIRYAGSYRYGSYDSMQCKLVLSVDIA